MLKPFLHRKLGPLLVVALLVTQAIAADPAPASPPSSSDPAPASPPISISSDPSPASPPMSTTSDPAPASPPSSSSPVPLIDMPTMDSQSNAGDPAPVGAPGSSRPDMLPSVTPVASTSVMPSKAFLGVGFRDPGTTVVTTLWSGSTAAKLGIQLGDHIVSINGSPVSNLQQIRTLMGSMAAGDAATVTIKRAEGGPVSVGPMPLGASFE